MKKFTALVLTSALTLSGFAFLNNSEEAKDVAASYRITEPWAASTEVAASYRITEPWAVKPAFDLAASYRITEPWSLKNKFQA